jgi:hypothetical protein
MSDISRRGGPPMLLVSFPVIGFLACILLSCVICAFSQLPQLSTTTVTGTVVNKFPVNYENGTIYHVVLEKSEGGKEIFQVAPSIHGINSTALQAQIEVDKKYTFKVSGVNLGDVIFRNIFEVTPERW